MPDPGSERERLDAWKRDDGRPRPPAPPAGAAGRGPAAEPPPDPALVARVRALMFEARELLAARLASAEEAARRGARPPEAR